MLKILLCKKALNTFRTCFSNEIYETNCCDCDDDKNDVDDNNDGVDDEVSTVLRLVQFKQSFIGEEGGSLLLLLLWTHLPPPPTPSPPSLSPQSPFF